ncbi:MAG: hypothetical protein D6719_13885 [Candidatus Dadabacteria bacterium]|nr:MAG: hypothetical protein D6719_13885 [Candidatus Dadabacteria bacterium]
MRVLVCCLVTVLALGCGGADSKSPVGPEPEPDFEEISSDDLLVDLQHAPSGLIVTVNASKLPADSFGWGESQVLVKRLAYKWLSEKQSVERCFAQPGFEGGWLSCPATVGQPPLLVNFLLEDGPDWQLEIRAELNISGQQETRYLFTTWQQSDS